MKSKARTRSGASVRFSVAVLTVGGLVAAGASWAADESPFANRFFFGQNQPSSALSFNGADRGLPGYETPVFASAYGNPTSADPASTAFALAKSSVTNYLLPSLGKDAPDWAKRVELEWDVEKNLKPTYSILTVQPLYQDAQKQNTFFVQASQLRYDMIDKYRDTTNVGLGYRRLLLGNQMLVGVNSFYDYEWTYGHQRASVGGELKWAMLDFNTNLYRRLTGYRTIDDSTSTTERAMNGYDFELRSQVPFLPWMQVGARYYHWQSDLADDTKGWDYSATADITQNLSIETGWKRDNYNSSQAYGKFVLRLARTDRPVMASDKIVSKDFFEQRDMRNYTLDKVRRENKIIVERKGGGIVIARGN